MAVAAGYRHSLGLKTNGSILAWGSNADGQCDVPAPNTDFAAVAVGYYHSLGLKTDGSIVAWGLNVYGQCEVSSPNTGFTAVAAGAFHSLGLRRIIPEAVYLEQFRAERQGRQAMVHWVISQPHAHAGFHLWRQEPDQERVCISSALLSGQNVYDFVDTRPPAGPVDYWLQELGTDGSENWYGPAHLEGSVVPAVLYLAQNHPNPFNPRTSFRFSLPNAGRAVLAIYDVRGARVATLVEADLPAGERSVEWTGMSQSTAPLPSGIYFARLETPSGARTVKLTLAR
jgi:hypothetical protein